MTDEESIHSSDLSSLNSDDDIESFASDQEESPTQPVTTETANPVVKSKKGKQSIETSSNKKRSFSDTKETEGGRADDSSEEDDSDFDSSGDEEEGYWFASPGGVELVASEDTFVPRSKEEQRKWKKSKK